MRAIVAVGVAILGAEVFTEILLQLQPREDPFWEWLITLIATGLAALFAIGVFEYQSRQAERDRQDKLLAALAAELQSNLSILRSGHRTPFFDQVSLPGTQKRYVRYADAKLVPLPPVAAESAIQSGVFVELIKPYAGTPRPNNHGLYCGERTRQAARDYREVVRRADRVPPCARGDRSVYPTRCRRKQRQFFRVGT